MGSKTGIAPRIAEPDIERGIWGARRVSLLVFENAEQPREYGEWDEYRSPHLSQELRTQAHKSHSNLKSYVRVCTSRASFSVHAARLDPSVSFGNISRHVFQSRWPD